MRTCEKCGLTRKLARFPGGDIKPCPTCRREREKKYYHTDVGKKKSLAQQARYMATENGKFKHAKAMAKYEEKRKAEVKAKREAMEPRKCALAECENDFKPRFIDHKYCSKACCGIGAARKRRAKLPLHTLQCARCGDSFETHFKSKKHCGDVCKTLARQEKDRKKGSNRESTRLRARKRKIRLVKMLGGKCHICGYDENLNALHFHHRDPSEKEFSISAKTDSYSMDKLINEAMKCDLDCVRCHAEHHNPDGFMWKLIEV